MTESGIYQKLEDLKALNRERFDYVLARSRLSTIAASLAEINKSDAWYYRFSEEERAYLEQLATELHYERKVQAEQILDQAVVDAALVKVEGLRSRRENIKQEAATEILDRNLGKPKQPTELTGKDGGAVIIQVIDKAPDGS